MADIKFKKKAKWTYDREVVVAPQSSTEIEIDILTSAKYLNFLQTITKNSASSYAFNVKASITCKILYAGDQQKDSFMIFFNRDRSNTDTYFVNTSILELGEKEVLGITLIIKNNDTTDNLIISDMKLYESKDLATQTLESGLKEVSEFKQNCEYINIKIDGSGFAYKFEGENENSFIFLTDEHGNLTGMTRQDGYVTQIRMI